MLLVPLIFFVMAICCACMVYEYAAGPESVGGSESAVENKSVPLLYRAYRNISLAHSLAK